MGRSDFRSWGMSGPKVESGLTLTSPLIKPAIHEFAAHGAHVTKAA
jgi:hypothetical protein